MNETKRKRNRNQFVVQLGNVQINNEIKESNVGNRKIDKINEAKCLNYNMLAIE